MRIILMSIVDDSDISLHICLFLNSEQTNYFKINEFSWFMVYQLKVMWPVTQTG